MEKTVVITGASKGIGASTAILFAEKGYNVVLNYNSSVETARILTTSLRSRGHSVVAMKADVANRMETDLMIKETLYKFGRIDVIVNNAGISKSGLITEIDDIDVKRLFDVNLLGTYNCCKSVTPVMVNQKFGKIINVASMWGETGASCEVAYSASKAGIIGLTKALAKELAPSGINVNCVSPGIIDTAMNKALSAAAIEEFIETVPLGRIGYPEEIARMIYYLSEEGGDYITGQVLGINGGSVI